MADEDDQRAVATELRRALKDIASFGNPALVQDAGQQAARRPRATLQHLGLYLEEDDDAG